MMRMRLGRALLAVAGMGILAVAGAPAGATVFERGHYAGTETFSYDDCGFPVDAQVEFSGVFRFREGKGDKESAFFLMDNFSYREVHTNADTGEFFVLRGDGVFNETKATRLEGSIFEFASIEAGQPFVVEDSEGNVILRDRGVIRRRIVFDTGGDDEPGGTEVEFLGAEVSGPHPGFFIDFCEIASDLIGS